MNEAREHWLLRRNKLRELEKPTHSDHKMEPVLLVRCPECKRENYSCAVATGVCVWCGFEAGKDGCNEEKETK